jgi:hypothetical protein
MAAPASAQTANLKANASARLIKPLTLTAERDLNFGTIVMGAVTANEAVTISGSGAVTCGTSGALTCTGQPQSALYRVNGTQGQVVTVSSAAPSFVLNGPNGATLSFVPSFPATVTLANSGATGTEFTVGGSVTISSSTVDGLYSGQIEIQVAYQ